MATADATGRAAPVGATEVLGVRKLSVSYGAVTALRGIDMEVRRGEVVALLGANGAGKSTMLRTISGLVRPRSGEIVFDGTRIDGMRPSQVVRRGIAHSPEGRRLFGDLTVAENLRLGAVQRTDRDNIDADRERLYELFPILKERARQQSGTLSGGEQQMVALSRALMARPRLLLLDEPSLGIAPIIVEQIFESLAELKASGVTMLLVEQNIAAALDLADRAYVLRTGEIGLEGNARDLRENYEEVAGAYLGARR